MNHIQVIRPGGITIRHEGSEHTLAHGTLLGLPVEAIHKDKAIYNDPETFLPFRFADPKAVEAVTSVGLTNTFESSSKVKLSATVDDTFLSFGLGKHACPGRFFALNELKMAIAHMVLHYDFEHQENAGPNTTPFLWLNVPLSRNSNVKIRKRVPKELF